MSKRELTKWKNKYKLWAILHGTKEMDCSKCPLMDWTEWSDYVDKEKRLSDGRLLVVANQCNYKRMMIDTHTGEIFWAKTYIWQEGKYCIEWVKRV